MIGICIGLWGREEGRKLLVNYNVVIFGYDGFRWCLNDEKIIDDMKYLFRGFVVIVDIFVK